MPFSVAIALSGGIDSLVSAALLKDQNHRLIALHFLTGYEATDEGCPAKPVQADRFAALKARTRANLQPLADRLDIPLYIIDLRTEFQRRVVNYFISAYQAGRTPNPCLLCNPLIKFNILLEKARSLGAAYIATGHYARIEPAADGRRRLLRGLDRAKEQSYFLARLSQAQLKQAILPLGGMTKEQTRLIARQKDLTPAAAQESQDVCFIKSMTYEAFLTHQPGFHSQPGPIVNHIGQEIGRHQGLHRFTIGQRRGINCPATEPYYVLRIDPANNRLVVGFREDLFSDECHVDQINWIGVPPRAPIKVYTRIRYRHEAVASTLMPLGVDKAYVRFDAPEAAVTPGQGAVFYQNDEVLGGGWIQ